MKVVILAGGLGTRLSEETNRIPKPLVKIGKYPILIHIMNIYSFYNHKDFIICGGYKYDKIVDFFHNFLDFELVSSKNKVSLFHSKKKKWSVNILFTGNKTNTGGRLLRIKNDLINEDSFFLTYGDGLSDININNLYNFHKKKEKLITITAVKPPGRFGVLKIKNTLVSKFQEKVDNKDVWINGGFFVFNKDIFKYLKKDQDSLENVALTKMAMRKKIKAYKHEKFWLPMDTLRDKITLNKIWKSGKAPWKK